MIRFIRGILYGVAAGIAAAFILDYLDNVQDQSGRRSAAPRDRLSPPPPAEEDGLSDEARKALLDELGSQLS